LNFIINELKENISLETVRSFVSMADSWINCIIFYLSYECEDDIPAHIKSSVTLPIPITNEQFNLKAWHGIYLEEHRVLVVVEK
jgi:thiamine phosphate synthase YjbQ (UPF0047 family)